MVCFFDYELIVPKNNLADFTKYVLTGIYGFRNKDLWFLSSDVEKPGSYRHIKLIESIDEHYKIQFKICTWTALCNVIPPVNVQSDQVFFANRAVFDDIKERVEGEVQSASDDMGRMYEPISFSAENIPNVVKQLAKEKVIGGWLQLDDGNFICRSNWCPILIGSSEGNLIVDLAYNCIFDFDDGCGFRSSKAIQDKFLTWKHRGDITTRIFDTIVI